MKKEKKTMKEIALKLTEKALRSKAEQEYGGWPPYCNGIFHQPKRPDKY